MRGADETITRTVCPVLVSTLRKVWIRKQNKAKQKTRKKWSGNSALEKVNEQGNLFSILKEKVDEGSDRDPNIRAQESIFLSYPSL